MIKSLKSRISNNIVIFLTIVLICPIIFPIISFAIFLAILYNFVCALLAFISSNMYSTISWRGNDRFFSSIKLQEISIKLDFRRFFSINHRLCSLFFLPRPANPAWNRFCFRPRLPRGACTKYKKSAHMSHKMTFISHKVTFISHKMTLFPIKMTLNFEKMTSISQKMKSNSQKTTFLRPKE